MINYKTLLKENLEQILPTYYESFANCDIKIPCITYTQIGNTADKEGDTIRYSRLGFQIKVWGDSLSTIVPYAEAVDDLMFSLNFKRLSTTELYHDGLNQIIMRFEALGVEK